MTRYPLPNVPYIQARHQGSSQKPTAIYLSLSDTTSDTGAAYAFAQHRHSKSSPLESFHYMVDETKTYRGVHDHTAAYSTPYKAIHVLLCAQPHEHAFEWGSRSGELSVLKRAADLLAQLSLAHRIRPRILTEDEYLAWLDHKWRRRGGIYLHVPGEFPTDRFLLDFHGRVAVKRSAA